MPLGIVPTRAERPRRSTLSRKRVVSFASSPGNRQARGRRLEKETRQHPALQQGARTREVAREQRQANAHDRSSTQMLPRQTTKVLPRELGRDRQESRAKRASAGDGDTDATSGREAACYPLDFSRRSFVFGGGRHCDNVNAASSGVLRPFCSHRAWQFLRRTRPSPESEERTDRVPSRPFLSVRAPPSYAYSTREGTLVRYAHSPWSRGNVQEEQRGKTTHGSSKQHRSQQHRANTRERRVAK